MYRTGGGGYPSFAVVAEVVALKSLFFKGLASPVAKKHRGGIAEASRRSRRLT